jgi:hypothetical protein
VTDEPPRTLDDLRAIPDPALRARAARAYIEQRQQAIEYAVDIRNAALRELLAADNGPAAVVRMSGWSLSTVKTASRGAPA